MTTAAMVRRPQYDEGKNTSGSTIGAFKCVQGGRTAIALAAGITAVPYGFTAESIEDGEFGQVQTEGWAIAIAGTGGVTEGQRLMPEAGATGAVVPWAASAGANATVVGRCEMTAAAGKQTLVNIGKGAIGQGA